MAIADSTVVRIETFCIIGMLVGKVIHHSKLGLAA